MYQIDIQQISFIHERLRAVLRWLLPIIGAAVITSLFRLNDDGIHGTLPLCALDIRCRNAALGKTLAEMINDHWQYDHRRPDMMVAAWKDKVKGPHLHIQVHGNTRLR